MKGILKSSFIAFAVLMIMAFASCSNVSDSDTSVQLPPASAKGTGNYIVILRNFNTSNAYAVFNIDEETEHKGYNFRFNENDTFAVSYGCTGRYNPETGIAIKPNLTLSGKNGRYILNVMYTAGGKNRHEYLYSYPKNVTFADKIQIYINNAIVKTIDVNDELAYSLSKNRGSFSITGLNIYDSDIKQKLALKIGKKNEITGSMQWIDVGDFELKKVSPVLQLSFDYGNSGYQIDLSQRL